MRTRFVGTAKSTYLAIVLAAMVVVWFLVTINKASAANPKTSSASSDHGRFLYIQSNNMLEGQNSVIAYERLAGGKLKLLPGSPFLTGGTGMNNNTHGKVGPHDNDTPIVLSANGKYLFTVNTHSNTIAAFAIMRGGSLRHVKGSPFGSVLTVWG